MTARGTSRPAARPGARMTRATAPPATLTDRTRDLRAQLATMVPAELLGIFDGDADALGGTDFAGRSVRAGQPAPRFTLPDATGTPVALDGLLARGPVVLTFYRGTWCPYCNLQLRAYQEILGDIVARGAQLVAVSPQTPDQALSLVENEQLEFVVLSDAGNRVADQYGLTYTVDDAVKAAQAEVGIDLAAYNGDATYRLPATGTYVIARDGIVRYARVNGDFRDRAEPAEILQALGGL